MPTWETKWLRGISAPLNPSAAMKFENRDAGTARRIRRPEKLKILCFLVMQVSSRGLQLVCKGEVEPRHARHKAARNLMVGQRYQSCRGSAASLGPGMESTRVRLKQRGDIPVLVMERS